MLCGAFVNCIDFYNFVSVMRLLVVIFVWIGIVAGAVNPVSPRLLSVAGTAPCDLLTEQLSRPLGVNTLRPGFSWKNRNIKRQTAYEIDRKSVV